MPRKSRYEKASEQLKSRRGEGIETQVLQDTLGSLVLELPPEVFSLTAKTAQQKQDCLAVKNFYRRVAAVLDSYFTMEAPPKYELLPKLEQEHIWAETFLILDFYSMVWANWGAVKSGYALLTQRNPAMPSPYLKEFSPDGKGGSTERVVASYTAMIPCEITSPAEAVSEFVKYRAIGYIVHAFSSDYHLTPYAITKAIKASGKTGQSYADKQALQKVYEMNPCYDFEEATLQIIKALGAEGKPRRLLTEYLKTRAEINRVSLAMNNRHKHPPGYHSKAG